MHVTRIYHLTISGILGVFVTLALYTSFTNRIENDAAFHALVSREIAQSQKIITHTSHILATQNSFFPIAYPQMFHFTGALLYLVSGDIAFFLLPVIYGTVALWAVSVIVKSISRYHLSALLGISFLAFNVYYLDFSSKYFMEIGLVCAVFVAVAMTIRYFDTNKVQYLFLASLFYGLSISIKQQGLFVIPAFLILLISSIKKEKSFRPFIISILLFIFMTFGPLVYLFFSTGSILYATDRPPRIIELIEKPARSLLGTHMLQGDAAWTQLNIGRRDQELTQWRNLNNSLTAWIDQVSTSALPWVMLTFLFVILLFRNVIHSKSGKSLAILFFALSFYAVLFYLARPRYALPLIILPSLVITAVSEIIFGYKHMKLASILLCAFFIVYIMTNFGVQLQGVLARDDYGYMASYIPDRPQLLQELYDEIPKGEETEIILTPLPYETALYTQKVAFWANPYGGSDLFTSFLSDDEQEALTLMRNYRATYVLIYSDRFMAYTNWAGITPNNGFLKNINSSPSFSLVFQNRVGSVYKIQHAK